MGKNSIDRLTMAKDMARRCIAVRIRLLNRMITNIYDSALSPFGIKLTQLNILMVVYLAGEIGYDALCKRLKMEKSTLSRNVERLKKKNWIEVISDKSDRKKLLKVSPEGEELISIVNAAWEEAQRKAEELVGKEGSQIICNIANEIWRREKKS